MEVKPGMIQLLSNLDKGAVEAMLGRVRGYVTEFGGYPTTAMNNVDGVLQYYLGGREHKEEAIATFQEVLTRDPENANALENCRVIYAELGEDEEAEKCACKLTQLLNSENSNRDLSLRRARCVAEQGFAQTFTVDAFETADDIGGKDFDRNVKAVEQFEAAFLIDNDNFAVFHPEERRQWQFFMGQSYHHIYGHFMRTENKDEDRLVVFNKAISILVEIARESSSTQYQAKAWALLGTFFWKELGLTNGISEVPDSISGYDLAAEYKDPDICFKLACDLSPTDPKLLSRYARFLNKHDRFEESIELLTKSIELDDSVHNWFAFSSRGNAYRMLYFKQQQQQARNRSREGPKTQPDRSLLGKARVDYEHSITIHPNLYDKTRLAGVLQLQGNMQGALAQFGYVVSHLEGQKNPEVHSKFGYCLSYMANKDKSKHFTRQAAESFKRAVEVEGGHFENSTNPYNVLRLLARTCGNRSNPGYLINELRFWLTYIQGKYQHPSDRIGRVCSEFPWQMLGVCKNLVERKQFELAKTCLSKIRNKRAVTQHRQEIQYLQDEISHCTDSLSTLSLSELSTSTDNILPPLRKACNKINKMYDCFILYYQQGPDAEWVYYSLLPRMEDCHGYKCHVSVRDTKSAAQATMIPNSVDEAACVIVILTPTFCKDGGCQEMLATLINDSSHVVLPVLLEECNIPELLSDKKVVQYHCWELLLKSVREACN